ncbi:hypothetical protein GGU10DRAFT_414998 [Lentinula aff. detonsa]|uniref:Uncharacterized protein n=1 Tax=Lentinula aff. detonsa TaxID=2804958 RepID=A0AA38NDR5_9AGAR|nr:hypothetical protein GGU10DRAFT_414998 [Lentinula aff. detonsa]
MLPALSLARPSLLILPLFLSLASTALIASSLGAVQFHDNDREAWFTFMERKFEEGSIPPESWTSYAIQEGLNSSPELQSVMNDRLNQYLRLSSQVPVSTGAVADVSLFGTASWPWEGFKDDISRISDAAKKMSVKDELESEAILDDIPLPEDIHISLPTIKIGDIDITLPNISLPAPAKILEHTLELIEQTKTDFERIFHNELSQVEEILRSIENIVAIQIAKLPREIRQAIEEFDRFRAEHPYVVAGISVALVIIGTEVILPELFMTVLNWFGFGKMGPIAGSWAAALQSTLYGGKTSGIFSILQRVAMSAKRVWPVAVFVDLVAVAVGTITVLSSHLIKQLVDTWYPELEVPDLNLVVQDTNGATDVLFDNFMKGLGKRCEEAGIPEVQWLDMAIESIAKAVREMIEE